MFCCGFGKVFAFAEKSDIARIKSKIAENNLAMSKLRLLTFKMFRHLSHTFHIF